MTRGLDTAFASPAAKAGHVRQLFATIANRYDLITRLLSFGLDARWKRRLVALACVRPGEAALDLACGTGDVARLVALQGGRAIGLDLTRRMVEIARDKPTLADVSPLRWLVGDMGALPLPAGTVSLVTTSYGLRNVPDLDIAIDEIVRVLAPGGRLLSLDFNRPESPVVRRLYLAYLNAVGGALGWWLHGDPDTYRYIPASIARYPGAAGIAVRLRQRGFADVQIVPVLFGLMTIHVARLPES